MNHLPSIEERVISFLRDTYGLQDSDSLSAGEVQKLCEMLLREASTSDRHALGEMILEWANENKKDGWTNFGKNDLTEREEGFNSALSDLQTFIKSEVMGKE